MSRLLSAAEAGNVQEVKRLIESSPDLDEKYWNNITAALHCAVESSSLDVVKCLVKHGADVNSGNEWNDTILHRAAYLNSLEIVKYLVKHGANVNCRNRWKETSFHFAARSGSMEMIKYLVENGANVNCISLWNSAALHYAVASDSPEKVQYLVEHGAEVASENKDGSDTVLYWACFGGNDLIVNYLLQHGAQFHDKMISLLSVACQKGHTPVVETLLRFQVDLRKEKELKCGNDEIINILNLELKKSVKHREKIQALKSLDNRKLTKVRYSHC
jgi:ankyrin repeat protein